MHNDKGRVLRHSHKAELATIGLILHDFEDLQGSICAAKQLS